LVDLRCQREGIPKRRDSMSKTMGGMSNVDRGWEKRLREQN